jgi:hypothetical protein
MLIARILLTWTAASMVISPLVGSLLARQAGDPALIPEPVPA